MLMEWQCQIRSYCIQPRKAVSGYIKLNIEIQDILLVNRIFTKVKTCQYCEM